MFDNVVLCFWLYFLWVYLYIFFWFSNLLLKVFDFICQICWELFLYSLFLLDSILNILEAARIETNQHFLSFNQTFHKICQSFTSVLKWINEFVNWIRAFVFKITEKVFLHIRTILDINSFRTKIFISFPWPTILMK